MESVLSDLTHDESPPEPQVEEALPSLSSQNLLAMLEEQNRIVQSHLMLVHRDSIPSNLSRQGSNEVDGGRKNSTTRVLTHNTFNTASPVLQHASAVGSFLLTTLHLDVDNDSQNSGSKDFPPALPSQDPYQLWGEFLATWDDSMKRRKKTMRDLVYQGIPDKVRCVVWPKFAKSNDPALRDMYRSLIERDSPFVKIIKRDLSRTFPDQEMFKHADGPGQEALFNIMKAYSIYDREVGYCQGSPFIAGLLLMQMPEEDAFCVFVRIMHNYGMRDLFKPTMAALDVCLHLLDRLVLEHSSDLHAHFVDKGLVTTMYASSWFLTIFASTLTVDAAFRLMDLFLCDSMDAVFRIALAILLDKREELLKLDMPGMMQVLQTELRETYSLKEEQESLFQRAFELKISHRRLVKQGKDYQQQREKDTEEAVENRAMTTENRKSMKKITQMEDDVQSMTEEVVACQMAHADMLADKTKLLNELAVARRQIKEERERQKAERQDLTRPLASSKPAVDTAIFLSHRVYQLSENGEKLKLARKRFNELELMLAASKLRLAELEEDRAELRRLEFLDTQLSKEAVDLRQELTDLRKQVLERDAELQRKKEEMLAKNVVRVSAVQSTGESTESNSTL